jgi:hypothetical protein
MICDDEDDENVDDDADKGSKEDDAVMKESKIGSDTTTGARVVIVGATDKREVV